MNDIGWGVSTATLVEKVRGGDMGAFTTLYRAHVGAVNMAVRDNVHDSHAAADVTQEVFVRALERLDGLRQPDRFRPWLLSIARHAAIDHRRARAGAPEPLDAVHEPIEPGSGPEALAELDELVGLLRGGVARLSVRDATALTLATQFGLTPTEMAAALGVTPGTAKVVLCRARRRLRQALADQLTGG